MPPDPATPGDPAPASPPDIQAIVQKAAAAIRQSEKNPGPDIKSAARQAIIANFTWIFGTTLILALTAVFVLPRLQSPWDGAVEYLVVGGLAGLVGYGELVSRYQDNPGRLFGASPTPIYILVNVAAGMTALGIIQVTGLLSGSKPPWLYQMMLAGFGSIAFFRTSLFTVRVGGTDVGIGPSALLQSLLSAADRMLDRDQAEGRAEDVASIMRDVEYSKARAALPMLAFILVQNLTPGDQENVGRQIAALDERKDVDPDAKSIILGVYLIRMVGADVLERSVKALGAHILKSTVHRDLSG